MALAVIGVVVSIAVTGTRCTVAPLTGCPESAAAGPAIGAPEALTTTPAKPSIRPAVRLDWFASGAAPSTALTSSAVSPQNPRQKPLTPTSPLHVPDDLQPAVQTIVVR